jgi:hypothetical protein
LRTAPTTQAAAQTAWTRARRTSRAPGDQMARRDRALRLLGSLLLVLLGLVPIDNSSELLHRLLQPARRSRTRRRSEASPVSLFAASCVLRPPQCRPMSNLTCSYAVAIVLLRRQWELGSARGAARSGGAMPGRRTSGTVAAPAGRRRRSRTGHSRGRARAG